MAKKKSQTGRTPKTKKTTGDGFRTIGIRVSNDFAGWLGRLAVHDHSTIARCLDMGARLYAEKIKFGEAAPSRTENAPPPPKPIEF